MNNDKLIMDNYLLVLKSTIEVYVHGTLESSNILARNTLNKGLDDTIKSQANTYDLMTSYGWYKVSNIETKEIEKTLKKLNQN